MANRKTPKKRINSRSKGQRGERAVIDWLQPIVSSVCLQFAYPELTLQRNTLQSDQGGSDITGLPGFAIEVKNTAKNNDGDLERFFAQALEQATRFGTPENPLVPVLVYKRPHLPLRVRIIGHIGWHSAWVKGATEHFQYNKPKPGLPRSIQTGYGVQGVLCDVSAQAFEQLLTASLSAWIHNQKQKQK